MIKSDREIKTVVKSEDSEGHSGWGIGHLCQVWKQCGLYSSGVAGGEAFQAVGSAQEKQMLLNANHAQ